MAWTVDWAVTIDGRDASSAMRPYLISIDISDKDGTSSDNCRLTFDDRGGQALLPKEGASVRVTMNGVVAFEGIVDSTPWTLTRGGGRLLEISAKGRDPRGKTKQGQRWHLDDATLGEALEKGASEAGLSGIVVAPDLAAIRRSYWSPDGASFLGWATRLARDLGATFKVRGDRGVFAARGEGLAATGAAMPTIRATIPGNVISVRLDPLKGRSRYKKARVRSFDRDKAEFKVSDFEFDTGEDEPASEERRFDAADEDDAKAIGKGRKSEAARESGDGTIEMLLQPEAQAEGTLVLTGARDGIDGTFRIVSVNHKADRAGGALTSLEIKQPGGGAGRDSRAPKKKKAAASPVAAPFT
ncbi:phage late control D family protein [Aureimonas sp. AU40]|uniref:phage late control D family protein n=1 Tax=Aureimonas sp. AU40 TaxID=1637747 RepID=UPI0007808EA8|nr:late control D family protein [Aureimonas sp. AU40]